MNNDSKFSERHGFEPAEAEISVHQDAPFELRGVLVDIAYEAGLSPSPLRGLVCRVLRTREDPNNWSEYPNIDGEVRYLVDSCEWYKLYDIIEEVYELLHSRLTTARGNRPDLGYAYFENEINKYFRKAGIGWQLSDGRVQVRGQEAFEVAVHTAVEAVERAGLRTASRENHEALVDLSRRPNPDITGALHHGLAALECVLREVSGEAKPTLGEILKEHRGIIPPPPRSVRRKGMGLRF